MRLHVVVVFWGSLLHNLKNRGDVVRVAGRFLVGGEDYQQTPPTEPKPQNPKTLNPKTLNPKTPKAQIA